MTSVSVKKMKSTVVFAYLFAGFAFSNALKPTKFPIKSTTTVPSTPELDAFVNKQRVILEVFQHIHQNDTQNKLVADSNNVNWTALTIQYDDPNLVTDFIKRQEMGLLECGEEFSVLKKSHIDEAISLFHLLHQAENWDTFYNILVWARFNMNEGVFIYASTVAILQFFGLLEVLGRTLLGTALENYSTDDYIPGVLEHFETSLRDPAFYQLYGRLIRFYLQWKMKLEPYTFDEINFEDVEILSVDLDRLTTYFDIFDSDITNAVDIEPMQTPPKGPATKFGKKGNKNGEDLVIKARQWRLNHLPFNLTLTISSPKAQRAIVKVFLGPKFDEAGNVLDINQNRENFYEIDKYIVTLKEGNSVVVRRSDQFTFYSNDRTSYYDLYKTVMIAASGTAKSPTDFDESICGFPQRLMLPKGKKNGFPVQLFVIVSEYRSPSTWVIRKDWFSSSNCRRDIDARALGFSLDREIDETIWYTSNMKYIETAIYHKSITDSNTRDQ